MYAHGVYTVTGPVNHINFPPGANNNYESLREKVREFKDAPGLLMWAIGNEWIYNILYDKPGLGNSAANAAGVLADWCQVIKEEDGTRPVVTVYGDFDTHNFGMYPALENCLDGWGYNMYRAEFDNNGNYDGTSAFRNTLHTDDPEGAEKFRFVGEYGIDAYNAHSASEVEDQQANAIENMMRELYWSRGWRGGFVFEWQDEWSKSGDANNWPYPGMETQDAGGWTPGQEETGCIGPCRYSEDWWGMVRADHTPRAAVARYAATKSDLLATPSPPSPPPALGECCSVCASDGGVACGAGLIDVTSVAADNGYGTCGAQVTYCQEGLGESRCGADVSAVLTAEEACQYMALDAACNACASSSSESSPPPEPPSPPSTGECCSVCASDGGVACGEGLTDVIGHFGTVAEHGTCEAQINYCTSDSDCGLGYGRAAACEYIGSVSSTTSGNCGACWATG